MDFENKFILEFFVGCMGSGKSTTMANRSYELMQKGYNVIVYDNIYKNSDDAWTSSNVDGEIILEDALFNLITREPIIYFLISSEMSMFEKNDIGEFKKIFLEYIKNHTNNITIEEKFVYFGKDLENCIYNSLFTNYFRSIRNKDFDEIVEFITKSNNEYNPPKVDVEVYKFNMDDVKLHLYKKLKFLALLSLKDNNEDLINNEVKIMRYLIKKTKDKFPDDTKDINIK